MQSGRGIVAQCGEKLHCLGWGRLQPGILGHLVVLGGISLVVLVAQVGAGGTAGPLAAGDG